MADGVDLRHACGGKKMRFELADLKREYKSDMGGVDEENDAF